MRIKVFVGLMPQIAFFLVLVDQSNSFDSWKLKRARPLLAEKIQSYLDAAPSNPGREVRFEWEGRTYSALADVLFVVHPNDSA